MRKRIVSVMAIILLMANISTISFASNISGNKSIKIPTNSMPVRWGTTTSERFKNTVLIGFKPENILDYFKVFENTNTNFLVKLTYMADPFDSNNEYLKAITIQQNFTDNQENKIISFLGTDFISFKDEESYNIHDDYPGAEWEKDIVYLPVRLIYEYFGFQVDWDQEHKTVIITEKKTDQENR